MEMVYSFQQWYYLFAAILAGSAVIGSLYRWFWLPMKKMVNRVSEEFSPNGGGSMRDLIDAIKHDLADVSRNVAFTTERLRLTGQREHCGEWESGPNGQCTYAGPIMTRMTGHPQEFWLGNNWATVVAEEDRDRVVSEWKNCVKYQRRFDMKYSFYTDNGKRILVHARANPVVIKGELIGFVGEMCPEQ